MPIEKITNYLLDITHPHGKSKASFFNGIGYSFYDAEQLQTDLKLLACGSKILETIPNERGVKYVIVGNLIAPNGKIYLLKTIWIIEINQLKPRLTTAYPN